MKWLRWNKAPLLTVVASELVNCACVDRMLSVFIEGFSRINENACLS